MKVKKVLTIVVLLLLAAALVCGYQRYFHSPLGRLVVDIYFQGIILDPVNYPADPPFTGSWEMTRDEVQQMEAELITFIGRNKKLVGNRISRELRSYRRYYLGLLGGNGEELINVYFCHKDVLGRRDWLQYYYETEGGGDYYWHVTYDVRVKTFCDFYSNDSD